MRLYLKCFLRSNRFQDLWCLRKILKLHFLLGLNVRAVICDQRPNKRKCYKNFHVTTKSPFLFHEIKDTKKKIYALYDPVHLTKSIRNILMKYDLKTPDGNVSFNIIKSLYLNDSKTITRMCPKLSCKHIFPNNFEKMR